MLEKISPKQLRTKIWRKGPYMYYFIGTSSGLDSETVQKIKYFANENSGVNVCELVWEEYLHYECEVAPGVDKKLFVYYNGEKRIEESNLNKKTLEIIFKMFLQFYEERINSDTFKSISFGKGVSRNQMNSDLFENKNKLYIEEDKRQRMKKKLKNVTGNEQLFLKKIKNKDNSVFKNLKEKESLHHLNKELTFVNSDNKKLKNIGRNLRPHNLKNKSHNRYNLFFKTQKPNLFQYNCNNNIENAKIHENNIKYDCSQKLSNEKIKTKINNKIKINSCNLILKKYIKANDLNFPHTSYNSNLIDTNLSNSFSNKTSKCPSEYTNESNNIPLDLSMKTYRSKVHQNQMSQIIPDHQILDLSIKTNKSIFLSN